MVCNQMPEGNKHSLKKNKKQIMKDLLGHLELMYIFSTTSPHKAI